MKNEVLETVELVFRGITYNVAYYSFWKNDVTGRCHQCSHLGKNLSRRQFARIAEIIGPADGLDVSTRSKLGREIKKELREKLAQDPFFKPSCLDCLNLILDSQQAEEVETLAQDALARRTANDKLRAPTAP